MNIEELLLKDSAKTVASREEGRVAVELLKPAMSKAALSARRRQKRKRERLIFLCALIPFVVMLAFAAQALLTGRWALLKHLAIPLGTLSLFALLTLPLLERFIPNNRHR